MRLLDDEVLELIGGGMDYVYVYAPYPDPGPGYDPNPTLPGGSGGSNPSDPQHHCPHSSPPPAQTPTGVDLNNIRNAALDVADQINKMDPNFEHAAMLIADQNGNVRSSVIVSSTETDGFSLGADLYSGEKIVGYIHNHPDVPGTDERFMSNPSNAAHPQDADTLQAANLAANPRSDPNLLAYILDTKTGDTFEYTGKGPDTRALGADVSKDSIPCG